MNRLVCYGIFAAAAASSATGCGGVEGQHPVSGKVLVDGEPAVGAAVYFHREDQPGSAAIPIGVVDRDGGFRLETAGARGAPAGRYAVLVEWRDAPRDLAPMPSPTKASLKTKAKTKVKGRADRFTPDRLSGRYFDRSAPKLHAEVKAESNELPAFELKS